MAQASSNAFDSENFGNQVGGNSGTITNNFHPPMRERPETPPQPRIVIPFIGAESTLGEGGRHRPLGRRLDMLTLHRIYRAGCHRVALVGISGIGKTSCAIEQAYKEGYHNDTWVFWISASSKTRIDRSFRTIAHAVRASGRNQPGADMRQIVYDWLADIRHGKWSIFVDGANDPGLLFDQGDGEGFVEFIPHSPNGRVLFTTQTREVARRVASSGLGIVHLEPMSLMSDVAGLIRTKWSASRKLSFERESIDPTKNHLCFRGHIEKRGIVF